MSIGIIHDPENKLKIGNIWAFLSEDDNGNEGVAAAYLEGVMMPLIAADEARLKSLIPVARNISRVTKKKIKLYKFTSKEFIEEI